MKTLIISADNFEDSELLVPYYRLKEARVEVDVASMKIGTIKGKHGYEVAVDKTLDAVKPEKYALLVLPGGKAPEKVRKEMKAIDTHKAFEEPAKTGILSPGCTFKPGKSRGQPVRVLVQQAVSFKVGG